MARLPSWPFTTMKICPIAYFSAKVGSKCYPKNWPKTINYLPKWQNFNKSSETASILQNQF